MAVFDRERALAGVDGDRELLGELVELFAEDCPRLLRELAAAVSAGDADGIARGAHALKGSVGVFGARRAADLANELEERGRAEELDGVPEFFAHLRAECESLLVELGDFVHA